MSVFRKIYLFMFKPIISRITNVGLRVDDVEKRMQDLSSKEEYEKLVSELDRLKFVVDRLKKQEAGTIGGTAPVYSEKIEAPQAADVYNDIDYFDFENHFRGSRAAVKKAQSQYLEYFRDCGNVVDIGCGRGEFLELMKENNIKATGVDIYSEYVDYCKTQGLDAVCGDGIEYIKECDEVDGIFAAQVVEHLNVHQIIALAENAYEKLKPGGYIILETPNPRSLSIYCNAFYMDPSHNKPVHPETLKYLFGNAGFRDISIVFTENSRTGTVIPPLENAPEFNRSMQIVENMLFSSQDYAMIAKKKLIT